MTIATKAEAGDCQRGLDSGGTDETNQRSTLKRARNDAMYMDKPEVCKVWLIHLHNTL